MLCCSAGMSTSLLVTKMKKAAEEQGKDVEIFAVPVAEADDKLTQGNIKSYPLYYTDGMFLQW